MPWCHHCNTEYREGFSSCADCGAPLYDSPPPKNAPEREDTLPPLSFLTSTTDRLEAEIILSKLKTAGIPAYRKEQENESYLRVYMGAESFGADIYVPEARLGEAEKIVEPVYFDEAEITEIMKELPDAEEEPVRFFGEHRPVAFLLALILIVSVILLIVL